MILSFLGSLTPSTEDFYREESKPNQHHHHNMAPPTAAPRSIKPLPTTSSSSAGSSESLTSSSSPDHQKDFGHLTENVETSAVLNEAAATSAASQAVMAAAAAKFGLEAGKGNTTSSSSSSTTSSRQRGMQISVLPTRSWKISDWINATSYFSETSGSEEQCRRVRTLYACVGEHESELSFEPNQVITDGKFDKKKKKNNFIVFHYSILTFSTSKISYQTHYVCNNKTEEIFAIYWQKNFQKSNYYLDVVLVVDGKNVSWVYFFHGDGFGGFGLIFFFSF